MRVFSYRAAGLAAIYLLVLSSLDPADVAIGVALGIGTALALRPRGGARRSESAGAPGLGAIRSAALVSGRTAAEIARGTWRTARFCLGAPLRGRIVELPRGGRSRHNVALWAILTGASPDEVVVDADEDRDALIIHVVSPAGDEEIRARHEAGKAAQREVVP